MQATTARPKPAEDALRSLMKQHFAFDSFMPGQREVMQLLLDGHSSAAVFPTGGGKSLCYQLPALALSGTTIVVSPLIALMKDQIDALAARGIAAVRLDSTLTTEQYLSAQQRLREGQIKLLYVAPERFNNERFRELVMQLQIALFAVDEAHCISEWGHNFRPDYLKLVRFAEMCRAQRRLALTATATERVLEDICCEFAICREHAVRTPFYRSNLHIEAVQVEAEVRDAELVKRLCQRPAGSTIVYVTLQKTAESVAAMLASRGLAARAYHAGMDAELRHETQEWFLSASEGIIVATIAFGMGIDKSDIRYVYHYNLSKSVENYAQEIGRSGRDGEDAVCETLLCWDDLRTLENFIYGDTPTSTAIGSLLGDIFARGEEFAVSFFQLARQHDIRELVVRTLLTYLELDDYIEGGTPYYAEYRFQPRVSSQAILAHFSGQRRAFVASMLGCARRAKTWFHIDVDRAAAQTNTDRARVVRALDYFADQHWLELRAAQLFHRYRRLRVPDSLDQLADELSEKALHREQQELGRLRGLVELMTASQCQSAGLARYFGEMLERPCGHCGSCLDPSRSFVGRPSADTQQQIPERIWEPLLRLSADHAFLAQPESLARLLCGISTPSTTACKLQRHELFGCCTDMPFWAVREQAARRLGKLSSIR